MEVSARREGISATLSILSIAIVLVTAGGYVPNDRIPRAPALAIAAIPHVNVLISIVAIGTIAYGWRRIRAGAIDRHRMAMVGASILFGLFLTLYLYRLAAHGGPTGFDGPDVIYRFVYLPILAAHIVLAIICIPLVFDALSLGITVDRGRLGRTRHPRVGRVAATLWIVSYALGTLVYVLLHWT